MSDVLIVIITAAATGAVCGPPGYAIGRWLLERYWPRRKPPAPPPIGRMRATGIPMKCPHCGQEFGFDLDLEGPFPPSNDPAALAAAGWDPVPEPMPLGERLLAEKRELQARRDALLSTPGDPGRLASIGRRIEAIDRELGRFN